MQKRASNVMKLSLEHQKLEEELRIMNERLKAAEQAAGQAVPSQRGSPAVHSPPLSWADRQVLQGAFDFE